MCVRVHELVTENTEKSENLEKRGTREGTDRLMLSKLCACQVSSKLRRETDTAGRAGECGCANLLCYYLDGNHG